MPSFLIPYKKYFGISLIVIISIIGAIFLITQKKESPLNEPLPAVEAAIETQKTASDIRTNLNSPQQQNISTSVIVDVKGAVKNPGVYHLQTDARVEQAIAQAGGFTPAANKKIINLAAKLQDEMVIYVLAKGEKPVEIALATNGVAMSGNVSMTSSPDQQPLVNLNTADETELQTLSGIGPAKSQAIVAYRTENGPFQAIEDIKKISGFGEKTFERLKPLITVQ